MGLQHHPERRVGGGEHAQPLTPGCLFQGMSETFETLHNLVHKGVKVVMDIPYELWNETSAEVADLKKQVRASQPSGCPASWGGGGGPDLWLRQATRSWGGGRGLWSGRLTSLASVSSGESQPPACPAVGCETQPSSRGSESVLGLCQCAVLWFVVRRAGGRVRGGDRGLVQEPPGGRPDSVPLRQSRAEGQGHQ